MARSAEKAMSLMNRWVDQQRAISSGSLNFEHRPRTANECKTVREAESQRFYLIRQLTALITQIQNPNLSEARLRQLNDDINKLLKTKLAFELRIKQLGGPDYLSSSASLGADSIVAPGGYRYFGAAKNLPGVQELLESQPENVHFRSKTEILKNLDLDYWGYRDEILEPTLLEDERQLEAAFVPPRS